MACNGHCEGCASDCGKQPLRHPNITGAILGQFMMDMAQRVQEQEAGRLTEEKLDEIIDDFDFVEDKTAPAEEIMAKIIETRNNARAQKDWAAADSIRNSLDKINIVLKDTKDGTVFELK